MRSAKVAADLAFFHPSIMGERSYPAQHLVAMYMPYFLPISMPIIRGLTSEIKRRFPFRCLRRASLGKQKPE